eukprot:352235-Chlamydomonas_euryale.AAC.1
MQIKAIKLCIYNAMLISVLRAEPCLCHRMHTGWAEASGVHTGWAEASGAHTGRASCTPSTHYAHLTSHVMPVYHTSCALHGQSYYRSAIRVIVQVSVCEQTLHVRPLGPFDMPMLTRRACLHGQLSCSFLEHIHRGASRLGQCTRLRGGAGHPLARTCPADSTGFRLLRSVALTRAMAPALDTSRDDCRRARAGRGCGCGVAVPGLCPAARRGTRAARARLRCGHS